MAKNSFTDAFLRSLRPRDGRYTVYEKDRRYEGFAVDVMPSGKLSFRYRYRLKGKREKVTIGSYPKMSLAVAREHYRDMVEEVSRGRSPAAQKKLQKAGGAQEFTFEDLAREWVEKDLRPANKNARQDETYLTRDILPVIAIRAPRSLETSDLWACIEPVQKKHPQAARRVRSVLKRILAYGISRGKLVSNPALGINPKHIARTRSRDRVLSREEIPVWLHAIETSGMARPLKLALRLLLLIPVRKGELLAARWKEVDLVGRTWDIPKENSKNGTPLCHRLPDQATAIFEELLCYASGSEWVLPSSRGNGRRPISKTTLNRALTGISGLPPDVVIHDLRRTTRTYLSELGVPPHVAELCLNHRPTGVAKVYDRAELLDQRYQALRRWERHLQAILRGESELTGTSSELDAFLQKARSDESLRQYVLKQLL